MTFSLSPGHAHDAPEGRELFFQMSLPLTPIALIMDRAYEGDETRQLAIQLGYIPVERLFRRLKGYRRIFSRLEKLDVMFAGFIHFALIVEALRCCVNTP